MTKWLLGAGGDGFTDSPMGMYQQLRAGSHDQLRRTLIGILGLSEDGYPADANSGGYISDAMIVEAVQALVGAAATPAPEAPPPAG